MARQLGLAGGASEPPHSPLAPERYAELPPIAGVRLAAAEAGIRYRNRTDLMLMELAPGTRMAGVLTRSLTASAPVEWCRAALKSGAGRAILVNSGNANAFTGKAGRAAVKATVEALAERLGCKPREVYVASTGVIGQPLEAGKIVAALGGLGSALRADGWAGAAAAIMTTDTFPKLSTRTARIGDATVTLNGIAKGSGMIQPDMATMLAFAATDAKLPADVLQPLLKRAAERSFNCITVDGDTSTSDTLLMAATGQARHPKIAGIGDRALREFRKALDELMLDPRSRLCGTERGPPSWSRSRWPGPPPRAPRGGLALPSRTRPWSRRRSRGATRIGAASSWRSARRARGPTPTSSPSPSAACRSRRAGRSGRTMTRRRSPAT
jgi:N-acetylglutamate synthase/N-acetylornithine aminotransferase